MTFGAVGAPVADPASQAIRSNLVSQYNGIIAQITATAQGSSFNGINLLNGDNLKLTFSARRTRCIRISTDTKINVTVSRKPYRLQARISVASSQVIPVAQ